MGDLNLTLTKEMLEHYQNLHKEKKKVEKQLEEMKKLFNQYFDTAIGDRAKGSITIDKFVLQRQIRTVEKYTEEDTVKRLEELKLAELIKKIPDDKKIKSAIDLGLLQESDLEGCKTIQTSKVIVLRQSQ